MAGHCFRKSQFEEEETEFNAEDLKISSNNIKNCPNDFQNNVKKAIEALNLCYDFETGFHYIKQ